MRSTPFVTLTVLAGLGIAALIDRLPVNSEYRDKADSATGASLERPQAIYGLRISPCQGMLAFYRNIGKQRGRILLERISTRERIARLTFGSRLVACFDFVSNDGSLIACYHDGSILRWRHDDGAWRRQLIGRPAEEIRCCATSVDGRRLAVGCETGNILVYDLRDSARLVHTLKNPGSVACVRFLPCGTELLSGSSDRKLRIWNVKNRELTETFEGHSGPVRVLASSDCGRILASGDDHGTMIRWDRETKKPIWSVSNSENGIQSLGISPNGRVLTVGTILFGDVQLRDLANGRLVSTIPAHRATVTGTEFLSDGALVTAGQDGEIHQLTPETLKRFSASAIR